MKSDCALIPASPQFLAPPHTCPSETFSGVKTKVILGTSLSVSRATSFRRSCSLWDWSLYGHISGSHKPVVTCSPHVSDTQTRQSTKNYFLLPVRMCERLLYPDPYVLGVRGQPLLTSNKLQYGNSTHRSLLTCTEMHCTHLLGALDPH